MDIDKQIADLEDKLRRLEGRYSQSNPSDVMLLRSMRKELKKLIAEKAAGGKGTTPSLGVAPPSS